MEQELDRVGVDFIHFPAIDAKTDPALRDWKNRGASKTGYVISDGAVACGLSHRKVWETFLAGGGTFCAVVEDDVLLSDSFPACLATDWIPPDVDVVKLETTRNRTHLGRAIEGRPPRGELHRLLGRHPCTGAYIISRKGAESLLDYMWPPIDAVDEVMFNPEFGWMPQAAVYQLTPAVAIQAEYADEVLEGEGFAESSIAQRSTDTCITPGAETLSQRLLRRGRNELKARQIGSAYVVVPFAR